jgi:hypothetical protein
MEEIAFKGQIKILLLGISMQYSNTTSNTHSCPIGGKQNWRSVMDKPQGYPGWSGRLWIVYDKSPTNTDRHSYDRLSQVYLHTGTGGYGWYNMPNTWRKYMPSVDQCYPLSWDAKIWADDWPLVRANIIQKEKEDQLNEIVNPKVSAITNRPINEVIIEK